jgi:hypothetical protein
MTSGNLEGTVALANNAASVALSKYILQFNSRNALIKSLEVSHLFSNT